MTATITATHIPVTDGHDFYVRTPGGALHADDRGVVVYSNVEDAAEVAEALAEGRAIRPRGPQITPLPAWLRNFVADIR